ncbi:MAG TPA: Ku protein [Polyangiales bacterium]|nr:Ku protein [Polyangiales bacterium]
MPRRAKSASKSRSHARQDAPRPQWSGTLSFGLVSVPVDVYPATRPEHVALRMLAPDGTPLARRYYCADDDKAVPAEHQLRGYEHEPGEYVVISDEELEALEPDKSRDIDLRLFVPAESIDPMYFERSYFLTPSGDTSKAYHLLAAVMERGRRAGIATFVMRDHEYLVAIFARGGVLTAETLRFADELRDPAAVGAPRKTRVPSARQAALQKLIERHARDRFDPDQLVDQHTEALRQLAARKAKKHADLIEVEGAEHGEDAQDEHVDLMRLLKSSLRA